MVTRLRVKSLACLGLALLAAALAGCGAPAAAINTQTVGLDARAVLRQAAEDPDAVVRMHAFEAMALTNDPDAPAVLTQALSDRLPAVRFAAIMSLGDIGYEPAKPRLLEMMAQKDTDGSVQCACIYALHRMKDDTYTSRLGSLLFSPAKEICGNAALAMGKMGDVSAVRPLSNVLSDQHDPGVQLQALESLAALGDQRSISILTAYARTRYLDERMVAVQALGRSRSQRSKPIVASAMENGQPPQLRLVAAQALARLGDNRGYDLAVQGVQQPDDLVRQFYGRNTVIQDPLRYQLQQLAALALGQMGESRAIEVLVPLLKSKDGSVRVAAAKAILQIVSPAAAPVQAPGATPPARQPAPTAPPAPVKQAAKVQEAAVVTTQPSAEVKPTPLPANVMQVAPAKD